MYAKKYLRYLELFLFLSLFSSCESMSCQGPGYEIGHHTERFPPITLNPALTLTITREGGNFIETHGLEILQSFLKQDGPWLDVSKWINQTLEAQVISFFGVSIRDVITAIYFPHPESLSIKFVEDDKIHIEVDEVWVKFESTVIDDNTGSACRIRGKIDQHSNDERMFTLKNIALDILLQTNDQGEFHIQTEVTHLDIDQAGIHFVTEEDDPWYYCNFPECADGHAPECGECYLVCGTAGFADDVMNFFVEALDDLIASMTVWVVNAILEQFKTIGGEVHPALLMGHLLRDLWDMMPLRFVLAPADQAFEVVPLYDIPNGGGDLHLKLALGLQSAQVHPCVGQGIQAPIPHSGPPSKIISNLPSEQRQDFALSLSESTVDHLIWTFYQSGGFCLEISSQDIERLTDSALKINSGTLSLILPELNDLVDAESPITLVIRPHLESFPIVDFQGENNRPIIHIQWPLTEIGLSSWMQGQTIQWLSFETRLDLSVQPYLLPDGRLQLGIESLDIKDLNIIDQSIFQYLELQPMMDFLTSLLANLIGAQGFEFSFSLDQVIEMLLGFPLHVESCVFERSGIDRDWLSMTFSLSLDKKRTLKAHPRIWIDRHDIEVGETLLIHVESEYKETVETQYRVDGLSWSAFQKGTLLKVQSPLFELPQSHLIEVRSRYVGRFKSLQSPPKTLSIRVHRSDPIPEDSTDPMACQIHTLASSPKIPGFFWFIPFFMLFWRKSKVGLFFWAITALLGSCKDNAGSDRALPCTGNGDCLKDQYCGCDGFCHAPESCNSAADCCMGSECIDGHCTVQLQCREDRDCKTGQICQSCQCISQSCDEQTPCPAPFQCQDQLCKMPESLPCQAMCTSAEVCIEEIDRCLPKENFCPDLQCQPGEQLRLENAQGILGDQCSLKDMKCSCHALPPLPPAQPLTFIQLMGLSKGQQLWVSAYERHYGDLVLAPVDAELKVGEYLWIDGIPDSAPNADPTGPRQGIGIVGDDVGQFADGTEADGKLGLAYYDATHGDLKMALFETQNQSWNTWIVDAYGDAGRFANIATLSTGQWVIAYQALDLNDAGEGYSAVRVAISNRDQPDGPEDFQIQTIEEIPVDLAGTPCGAQCRPDEVCLADQWQCAPLDQSCLMPCWGNTACVQGQCVPIATQNLVSSIERLGTGVDLKMTVLDDDTLVLAYRRIYSGALVLALNQGDWQIEVIDPGQNRAGFGPTLTGQNLALSADMAGLLHLAYVDEISGELNYLQWDPQNHAPLVKEIIDPGLSVENGHMIGKVDIGTRSNTLWVAYQDASHGTLQLSRRTSNGEWIDQQLSTGGLCGFWPSLKIYGDRILVAHGRAMETDHLLQMIEVLEVH